MNPAALQVHQKEVKPGGTIICNANAFTPKNLKLAGYETNPLEDKTLDDYFTVYSIEMGKMVTLACEGLDLSCRQVYCLCDTVHDDKIVTKSMHFCER